MQFSYLRVIAERVPGDPPTANHSIDDADSDRNGNRYDDEQEGDGLLIHWAISNMGGVADPKCGQEAKCRDAD
jgi:hypothetical protein